MYRQVEIEIEGASPLIHHNQQGSDPLNPLAKLMRKFSKKRTKTDQDHSSLARLEWIAGLYTSEPGSVDVNGNEISIDGFGSPCVPGENLEKLLVEGATKKSLGRDFKSGVFSDGNFLLRIPGQPTTLELFNNPEYEFRHGARVAQSTVMRTRPIFRTWSLRFVVNYLPSLVDRENIQEAIQTAGQIIGLCDWRPRYGRFTVQSIRDI